MEKQLVARMLPCVMCEVYFVTEEVHLEEGGMCLACSDDYYSHDHADCSWYCMAVEFPAECRRKRMEEKK